jgi:hypothetical protein
MYFVDTFTVTSLNIYLITLYFILFYFLSIWLVNQPSFFIGRSTALFCSEIKKKISETSEIVVKNTA